MRRMYAELPPVWRYVLLTAAAVGLWFVLRWVDQEETPHGDRVAIHVKLRFGGRFHPTGSIPTEIQPLFSHHVHGATTGPDPRTRWWELDVPAARANDKLAELLADPGVEQAYVEPLYTLPSAGGDSCPITTPTYDHHQDYLGPAPGGIDAPRAWSSGTRGAGVQFADIEGGWNAAHEDLPGARITHVAGRPIIDASWRAHGTAVLGEVVGRDNGKGVIGIAPDVDHVFTSSIGGESVADAIDSAAEQLHPGDVLLIELQGTGPRGRYVPIEFWDDNFEAIQIAVARGIVVVEAAGNGNEDLDLPVFKRKFDRWSRDSGAILVGAGAPPREGFRDRTKLDFSNYGSRVDVQGWGRKVTTLDYGDLQSCKGADRSYTDRHYTGEFSGTSSASPIVAGAAILVESYVRTKLGTPLSPNEVRALLRATGTPQAGDVKKQIGPRPDLARAFAELPAIADRMAASRWPM
ncbi:MAG TPA: S8 family peptidase [Kofleriaceae bacterium]|nr:S8 family peptidase [Kofleriaceae bacterium]